MKKVGFVILAGGEGKRFGSIKPKQFVEINNHNSIEIILDEILNIDINFICEKPKISKYSKQMKENISKILNIKNNIISIKATTNEKIGFIGNGDGIAAEAIISINL